VSAEREATVHAELVAREAYLDAGRRYDAESQGGERPLEAGAAVRIAAKRWAAAERARDAIIAAEGGEQRSAVVRDRPCPKCNAPLDHHYVRVDGHELRCPGFELAAS
jgi:hypothetical protein